MTNLCFKENWNDDPELRDVFQYHLWTDGQLLRVESQLNTRDSTKISGVCQHMGSFTHNFHWGY